MKKNYFQHEKALVSPAAQIGDGTRVWAFTNIADGAIIGKECNICDGCYIEKGAIVGNHVTLKNGVYVFDGITLEDDVFCGANVVFINDRYPRSNRKDPWVLEKILVKKGATLGSNATLLCGITVGKYALIAAGSVVTKDVSNHTLVAGNPAKFAGYVCCCGRKLTSDMKCNCGLEYVLSDQQLRIKE